MEKLTNRQLEVLRHVCFGLTTKEIAAKLRLSVKTVDKHREDCYCKCGARDVLDLLRAAFRSGHVEYKEWMAQPLGPPRPSVYSRSKPRMERYRQKSRSL